MPARTNWIGVDLHSRVIQVCVLNASGDRCFQERYLGSSLAEGLQCVQELAERFPKAKLAVEALGSNRWFVRACREHGLKVTIAHGSRLALKDSGRKTDQRDSFELARRHRLGDIERNAQAYHPDDEEYGWRQLLRRRHGLVEQRSSVTAQLRAMLRTHRIKQPTGDLYGPRNLEKIRAIRLQNEDEQTAFDALAGALEALDRSIRGLDRRTVAVVRKHPRLAPLLRLPFVGPITATTLIAELGDVHRFRNAKAVASYAGLVPRVFNSADQENHGRLVRHGNRELRFVLGEWAVQLLARHELVRTWAASRLARMPKNKVRVALARKLLVGVWHTLRSGEVFSLERCLLTA